MARTESLVCSLNLLLMLTGVALIVVSVAIRTDSVFRLFVKFLDLDRYYVACYLSISSGIILLALPFIACFGLALQKHYLFIVYCFISMITISLHIASCSLVWKVTESEQFHNSLRLEISEHINSRYEYPLSYEFVETLQSELQCCGAESYRDYPTKSVTSCRYDVPEEPKGCAEAMQTYLRIRSALIGSLSIVSLFIQVLVLFIWYTGNTIAYKIIKS
ncbi:uncharacterized protein LOC141855505 [Brevipalpus obovatus]|uniref:uncharacterized protein LOC141855505 n=1 Tax=Brevipalpus obovatus TaxID=246614 RepID=UPI003D9DEF44